MIHYIKNISFILILCVVIISCRDSLPIVNDLKYKQFNLVDQDSSAIVFPTSFSEKIIVAGYIFTNCPDICPLTTNNMRLVQERLKNEKVEGIQFVSVSFDPVVDSPSVLEKFAKIRKLDLANWSFLTGQKPEIDKLMKEIGILAVPGDTSFIGEEEIIFYIHTDRISLIDQDGQVRKNYPGSTANIDEIINDIKLLEE